MTDGGFGDDGVRDGGRLIVVTGIMAAGKSTVAQGLAERFPLSAHVRGDVYRRSVVSGRAEMTASPSAAALDQLRLRYRLAVSTAESYRRNGFTVVLQDVIIGPMLDEFVAMVEIRPFSLVVLAPQPDEVARREERRTKIGYRGLTVHDLDHVLRNETPRLGHWLDSTNLTVAQTIDQLMATLDTTARIA